MSHTPVKRYHFNEVISDKLKELNELDNWHGPLAVLQDYLVIAAAIMLSLYSYYFYPLTLVIIGARQGALANLAHEAGHGRLTKNRRLNNFIGSFLSGYLIIQETRTFIDSHVRAHHIYLGDKEKDPDYSYHLQVGLYEPKKRGSYIHQYILKPLYLGSIFHYMKNIFSNRAPTFSKYKYHALIMTSYLSLLVAAVVYMGLFKYLLLFWFVPYITVFPTIGWFIDFVEHYPLVDEGDVDLYMTRNRFSNVFEHLIFNIHNENYHLVHHLRSAIPFWNLPKAHAVMMEDEEYRAVNEKAGGIFLSSNGHKSFIRSLMDKDRKIFQAHSYN